MIPGSANSLLLASAAGAAPSYQIERSLRFNSADSAYLSRTPSVAGNRKTWTWAGWIKQSNLSLWSRIFSRRVDSNNQFSFFLSSGNDFRLQNISGGAANASLSTSQVFRDPSAWFHLVLHVNTTQATAADRLKLYVNGLQITQFSSVTYPSQDLNLLANTNALHEIGAMAGAETFDGYLADVHFIDGQALDPTSFGEFDTNNVWQPKAYTGTYGTNGFHLGFADNSAATAAALGKDTSGNSNNWTPNNLSVTAGAGNDSLVDSPTNYGEDTGAGGEVRGNYATLNPLDNGGLTLANGNLDSSEGAGSWKSTRAIIGISSGKWYWEVTATSGSFLDIGISKASEAQSANNYVGFGANGWGYVYDGKKYNSGVGVTYGATYTSGDVIGVAFDADNGTLAFYKNNVSQGTAFTGLTAGPYFPAVSNYSSSWACNFGQRPFAYTAPSGYKALCTTNLPDPVVAQPSTAMDVKLYTGNFSTQTISGLKFESDLVWIKERSGTSRHWLADSVRGITTKQLLSDGTEAELSNTSQITSVSSSGFTLGGNTGTNSSAASYAAWCWDAGSSTVTNTQGSITSQVRANPSAGFSIVTYTGAGGVATVGHGLGVPPEMLIIKSRSATANWVVYHKYNTPAGAPDPSKNALYLNSTSASATNNTYPWNSTQPSSTVFTGNDSSSALQVNLSGSTYVAYCFAPVDGYSSFGSYTGNGSADGPFVYTNMLPRWIMVKRTDTTGNWTIIDTARLGYNVDNNPLYPNLSDAEGTADLADILSNGFKLRATDASVNASGGTYVYASFALNPFAYSRSR